MLHIEAYLIRWSALVEEKHQEIAGNRPTAGARYDESLPVGNHKLQLYSLATPNGQKVAIMLEELLALGVREAEYDAFLIKIIKRVGAAINEPDIMAVMMNPGSSYPLPARWVRYGRQFVSNSPDLTRHSPARTASTVPKRSRLSMRRRRSAISVMAFMVRAVNQ